MTDQYIQRPVYSSNIALHRRDNSKIIEVNYYVFNLKSIEDSDLY